MPEVYKKQHLTKKANSIDRKMQLFQQQQMVVLTCRYKWN